MLAVIRHLQIIDFRRIFKPIAVANLLLIAAASAAAATPTVLYDHTQLIDTGGLAGSGEMGQIIQLAQPSYLTRFAVAIGLPSSFTTDFTLRIYEGVELHAGRGDLIWSGVIEEVRISSPGALASIDLPLVAVPELFAWTIDQELATYSAILHGSRPHPAHFGASGGWIDNSLNQWRIFPGAPPFAARIEGIPVPEPQLAIAVVPLALLSGWRFRRRAVR